MSTPKANFSLFLFTTLDRYDCLEAKSKEDNIPDMKVKI